MVVGAADGLATAIGEDAVLLEPDRSLVRKAPVEVGVVARVTPRAEEAVLAVAVAHPAQVRMGVQHREQEALERASVAALIELALLNQLGPETRGGGGVLEHARGVRRGEPGGLGHRRVEQRARARPLLAPGHAADDRAGEAGEQHHETHQGQGEGRALV
jgi:hypothetical protein